MVVAKVWIFLSCKYSWSETSIFKVRWSVSPFPMLTNCFPHLHSILLSILKGGLTAVIYTDTLCTFLMVTGSLTVMGLGNFVFCATKWIIFLWCHHHQMLYPNHSQIKGPAFGFKQLLLKKDCNQKKLKCFFWVYGKHILTVRLGLPLSGYFSIKEKLTQKLVLFSFRQRKASIMIIHTPKFQLPLRFWILWNPWLK